MAKDDNSPQVSLHATMMAHLRRLVRTGMYGRSETEAIRSLLHDKLIELLDSGLIDRLEANVKEAQNQDRAEQEEGEETQSGD